MRALIFLAVSAMIIGYAIEYWPLLLGGMVTCFIIARLPVPEGRTKRGENGRAETP